jgi:hypothetical protein
MLPEIISELEFLLVLLSFDQSTYIHTNPAFGMALQIQYNMYCSSVAKKFPIPT